MSQINFQELLEESIKVKASGEKSGIADVAIVTFACGFVLTTIVANCFGEKKAVLPPQSPSDKK